MAVVRYVALAALVFWLGGVMQAIDAQIFRQLTLIGAASGAAIVVALFVMKFVGPPPHAFVPRVALVLAMLAATGAGALWGHTAITLGLTLALGLVLLTWYATE
jgi:hypothetical protein